MAMYPQHRRGFENDTDAPTAQQIKTADDKWKGHAVTGGSTPDTIKLAGDGDEVWGSIAYFDSGEIVITDEGEDVPFKNSGTAKIAIGSKIVGATRTVDSETVYGYVKAFDSAADASDNAEANVESAIDTAITAALKAKGTVVDGGADTNTVDEDVPADVKVAFSRCA